LAPNITELLFSLGLGDNVVGVTNFCDYPEEAKKKKKIGGMSNPSLEAVLSLTPDLVILTTDGNPKAFHDKLTSLGLKTYVFQARRLSEFPAGIRELGEALDVSEKADELARKIESAVTLDLEAHDPISSVPVLKKKVLFVIWPEPLIASGPGTVIDDVLALFCLENIASQNAISYPRYSIEEIIYQNPDIIFIGRGHANVRLTSEKLLDKISIVSAVRNGKVFFLSDRLYRLSPRIIQGIEEMATCLK
jgi:iron complex transport system substrate-binding protein